ncbi:GNAT family N-acetyltransferase [Clostridium sp. MSJ-11]|uniref:GNAT family N-acetyltransferase n=1 Tax=Clostridium mobile TaxID=2841512 RepID=A0ABS6EGM8_9CLOT|nr:GNAT family N-acetyltransferase [Clostridium mobile]MBU5484175.1 GNAT family N-acetyltransferase [Clostridium mobile]
MEIRLMNEQDDCFAISNVYEESWKGAYKGIIPQAYLDSIPKGRWVQFLNDSTWNTLIMLDGDKIIGTSSYGASRFADMNGYGEIISIYLLPEYFGKGYGKQLLQTTIDGLIQMGYKDIFLWVLETNSKTRHFYERFGFETSSAYLDDDIGGKRLREIQYIYHAR